MDTVPVIWHLHFLQPRNFWRHARGIEIREIISVITGQYINHRQPHYRMCSGPVVEGSHGDFFLDLTCLTRLGKTRIGAEAASDSERACERPPRLQCRGLLLPRACGSWWNSFGLRPPPIIRSTGRFSSSLATSTRSPTTAYTWRTFSTSYGQRSRTCVRWLACSSKIRASKCGRR